MRSLLLLTLSLLLLAACSTPQKISTPTEKTIPFAAKNWLATVPEGDYSIGISYSDPMFGNTTTALARDFAAVVMSRNHSAYVVDKQILLELAREREIDLTRMSFNFVVSADMDFLSRAARDLVLLDSFNAYGFFIGLYGLEPRKLSAKDTAISNSPTIDPEAAMQEIYLEGNTLYSTATSRQAELQDAFNLAQEKALRQIAQYRLQTVLAKIRSYDDETDQAMALETVTRNQQCRFDSVSIIHHQVGETHSYSVTLRLKADK